VRGVLWTEDKSLRGHLKSRVKGHRLEGDIDLCADRQQQSSLEHDTIKSQKLEKVKCSLPRGHRSEQNFSVGIQTITMGRAVV
jgi:hypothetical protein